MSEKIKKTLFPSTEIMGSFLSHQCSSNDFLRKEVEKDVKAAMLMHSNVNLQNITVNLVENNKNNLALTLPYYDFLDNKRAFEITDDAILETVTGGEIIITIAAIAGSVGVGVGLGVAGASLATASGFTAAAVAIGAAVIAAPTVAGVVATTAVAGAIGGGISHTRGK